MKDNKLIAEFMGCIHLLPFKNTNSFKMNDNGTRTEEGKWYRLNELKYHSSWDWLMPVIEKIERLGYAVNIYEQECRIFEDRTIKPKYKKITYELTKIEAVYKAVVEFIKWYNKK